MNSLRDWVGMLLFICFLNIAQAQSPFPNLQRVSIKNSESIFDIQVHYDPSISTLINEPLPENDAQIPEVNVIDTKIDRTNAEAYHVVFSEGASADPMFDIYRKNDNKFIGSIPGLQLYIPGNGALYVAGHTNNNFNQRKKYVISNERINEIKQAYYYVGIDSVAKQNLQLTAEKAGGGIVANIAKGTSVFVILNEESHYLVKSSFGLTGWVEIENGQRNDDILEGIYFRGD